MNNDPRVVRWARMAVSQIPRYNAPPLRVVESCKQKYPLVFQSISEVERNVHVRHTILVASFAQVRSHWCEVPEPVFENLVATVMQQLDHR